MKNHLLLVLCIQDIICYTISYSTISPSSSTVPTAARSCFSRYTLFAFAFVFFPFYPCNNLPILVFFVTSLTLSIYISLSLYKSTDRLHFGYTVSGRQFPRSFLFPFSFLFFSIFSAAKHSSEDDNSEDVWLDLFLLEEDGCWLGFGGNARSPVFNARIYGCLCSCFSLRLKSLKHALFNEYLASFLGSMDTFTRSIEAQLVVSC